MRNLWIGLLGGAALMLTGAGSANAQLVIDNFSVGTTGGNPVTANDGTPTATDFNDDPTSPANLNIIGGERDVIVTHVNGPNDAEFSVSSFNFQGNPVSAASFSTGSLTEGELELQYDGEDNSTALNPTGLGGVDLLSAGTQFSFTILFADLPGATVSIDIFDMDGNQSNFSNQVMFSIGTPPAQDVAAPFVVPAPFAAFTPVTASAADFSNVGAIRINLSGGVAIDLTVDSITVPEPGTLGLFGTGLLALGWFARRQHRRRTAA